MGGWKPAMQGKEGRLDQKPGRHHRYGDEAGEVRPRLSGQKRDVHGLVMRHQQRHAKQVGQRSQERDQKVAQRRRG